MSDTGASYFYESSSHTSYDDLVYDCMKAESYNYVGGVAIHQQMEVVEFTFSEYYATLQTRIEQNQANDRVLECIVVPFVFFKSDDTWNFYEWLWNEVTVR